MLKPCNKESCAKQKESEDVDKINIDDAPVQESLSNLSENQLMAIVHNDNNEMEDVSPIVTKTSSGDLKVVLDQKYIRMIDKKIQDNTNLFVELNKTISGDLLVSLHKQDSISNIKNKVLAKKTSSGNILLEFDKKVTKKCFPNFVELQTKVDTKIRDQSFIKDSEQKNSTKYVVDTIIEKSRECKTKNNQLFEVKVKGTNDMDYELFAIRQTDFGVYELILDKEFEKWYMQTINEQHTKNEDGYIYLVKTDSGHFLININSEVQDHSESQRALLIKSNSGNIKVIVRKDNTANETISKNIGSVLSPQTLNSLWNKPSYASREFHKGNFKKSRIIATKSSSDSNVYGRVKFDIQYNQNLIASEAVLKKTSSGQYTVVLDKESKNAFISSLKKTISSSSKGLIPIKRTDSGNIIVSLNTDHKNQCESLKITQSGKIYVVFKKKETEQGISSNTITSKSLNIKNESKWPKHFDTTKTVMTKATTTTCHRECKENSCDESKCICGGYESNISIKENAEIFSNIEVYDSNTLFNEDSNSNSKEEVIENSPHIVIKPCGFYPVIENIPIDENYNAVPTCPYHIGRYTGFSNEILEISGLCQRIDIYDNKKPVENSTVIRNKGNIDAWDSVELLPPQLPPFLKAYSLK
ncbi:jg5784 [Pararge aegeria aegeria]|uniref:Jg5784 protein n=1 Tax=Pararge aegeria aegeria TaxID=348720 RepID=A0A8S4R3C1_9NEOP|nr:jg5784 [Pararge aegeria aegeria]